MKIGEIFAYRALYNVDPPVKDGLPNFFHKTRLDIDGAKLPLLDKGINGIAVIDLPEKERTPAILISSSPHKTGSIDTPWQDYFDPDNGHIRYYGDNKRPGVDPAFSTGNKVLLKAFEDHNSPFKSVRRDATPILFFKRVTYKGRPKGNVMFQGFGVVERIERVTQHDEKNNRYFSNYVFDFAVFDMSKENEVFNWEWINDRRQSSITDLLKRAPHSWKEWIKEGNPSLPKYKRNISSLLTVKSSRQKPKVGSEEAKALKIIYEYYDNKKHRFEGLAAVIAEKILNDSNNSYKNGWITPSSNDGGSDFIGRLDIGNGFSTAHLVVLGQAKCEKLDTPTNGNHIARTVARLKRGWIGLYVTTSYYSEAVQKEIIDDKYPIVLVHGLKLTEEVLKMKHDRSFNTITDLLDDIDKDYDDKVRSRRPEEVMYI